MTNTYYNAKVISSSDYYPFGIMMPQGSFNSLKTDYRFGFNGQEKDDEINGTGADYDYGARFYDPMLGRWHSVDPMIEKHYDYTPYAYVYNNPLRFIDPFGLDSAERAQFIGELKGYAEANAEYGKGTYGSNDKTPSVDEVKKGEKTDCAGLMACGQKNIGNGDPRVEDKYGYAKHPIKEGKNLYSNGVAMEVDRTLKKTVDQIEEGDYAVFQTDNHTAGGKYDHIGAAFDVVKDNNGKTQSFKVIHSFGESPSGPQIDVYNVANPNSWMILKGVYKWDIDNNSNISPSIRNITSPEK